MFNIGDLVVYSTHGVCKIENICEKTIANMTRQYYELSPVNNEQQLTISAPVDGHGVTIQKLMDRDEAGTVLESFKLPTTETIDIRPNSYSKLVDSGDRIGIANTINNLMRKKREMAQNNKKLNRRDQDFLDMARGALFKELAISLDTSSNKINEKVVKMINQEDVS